MNTMTQPRMSEKIRKPFHQIERERLQSHLIAIDRDPNKLQAFVAELYTGHPQNPHVLYAAATHLTALTYLDRRDNVDQPILPESGRAGRAFTTYARLLHMLNTEMDSPLYANDPRVRKRLVGAREELLFHAILSYATMRGADFVALPAPAELDFEGAEEASDVHIYFPDSDTPTMEIQVTVRPARKVEKSYHPRIPVLSLAGALESVGQAQELSTLLASIGALDDTLQQILPQEQHDLLLSSAASILGAAKDWEATAKG